MSQVLRCAQLDGFRLMRFPFVALSHHHFIHVGWWAAEFFDSGCCNIGVVNHQMRGLVFFMLGAGVVEIGQLVEGQFTVAFHWADQVSFISAVGWKIGQFFHVLMAGA